MTKPPYIGEHFLFPPIHLFFECFRGHVPAFMPLCIPCHSATSLIATSVVDTANSHMTAAQAAPGPPEWPCYRLCFNTTLCIIIP